MCMYIYIYSRIYVYMMHMKIWSPLLFPWIFGMELGGTNRPLWPSHAMAESQWIPARVPQESYQMHRHHFESVNFVILPSFGSSYSIFFPELLIKD